MRVFECVVGVGLIVVAGMGATEQQSTATLGPGYLPVTPVPSIPA